MENLFSHRKKKKPNQQWNPHWSLKVLATVWNTCFGVLKIALGAVITVLLICLVCGFVFVGILGDYLQNDILPEATHELSSADLAQTSFMYYLDEGGNIQLLQQIHTDIDRQWAPLSEIPDALIHATVAIEDKRFYEHQGVDWITTLKACAGMFLGTSDAGGSTITQQFIKNDTGDNSVTVQRKVTEIFRAIQFEKNNNKDTIMEWYLNSIYLGSGCYGVKSAASEYFGKELSNLTIAECASLISITNNPSIFSPYGSTFKWGKDRVEMTGAERNRKRQVDVLWSMKEQGWITEEEYQEALDQEMVFKRGIAPEDRNATCANPECGYVGTVSTYKQENGKYFCPTCGTETLVNQSASKEMYSYYVETAMEDVVKDLAALEGVDFDSLNKEGKAVWMKKFQRGGYHVYTCLDMKVQNAIDRIYTNLDEIPTTSSRQQLQSGIVIIDNRTGDIVGLSGGVGEKTTYDAWNVATDARLQTGSAQKPLSVYAPGFENGTITPATVIKDLPKLYAGGKPFPKNDTRKYGYSATILDGITRSVNAVAVNTLNQIGYDYSYEFAHDLFGLSTLVREHKTSSGEIRSDLGDSPLAMGALTVGTTVRDMSEAYATFANNGTWREGRTYTKVYDSDGKLVLDNTQDSKNILSEKSVNYMNYCLVNATSKGTGTPANIPTQIVAGKTGSTSSNRDRWYCGYTGYYTAAVWCGYNNPEQIKLTGANKRNPAARLWKKVMEPLHEGKPAVKLYSTANFRDYSVCLDSGKLATDACALDLRGMTRTATAKAYSGDGPKEACDKHVAVDYCVTGGGVATEYCHKFADVTNVRIEKRALVKMTEEEVEEIKKASKVGLPSQYTNDAYVYYVSDSGADLEWHGFSGKANKNMTAPYVVCPVHTKEAWENYQRNHPEPEVPEFHFPDIHLPGFDH